MSGDKKIVQPGEVNFEDSSTKADETEKPTQNQNTTQQTNYSGTDKNIENMRFLSDNLNFPWKIVKGGNSYDVDFDKIKSLVPYVVTFSMTNDRKYLNIKNSIENSNILISFLEENYGNDLDQTGIYEETGLDKGTANMESLITYFPEFNNLKKIDGKLTPTKKNPFLTLLTLPLETRSFFSGILKENTNLYESSLFSNDIKSLLKPITTKHAMDYARKTNELPKIKDFMRWYSEV